MSLLFIPAINSQPFKLKWWRVLHRFVYSAIYHGGWLIIQLKNIKVYGCLWKSMDKAKKIESVNVWWETKITWGKCNLSYIRLLSRARLVIESWPGYVPCLSMGKWVVSCFSPSFQLSFPLPLPWLPGSPPYTDTHTQPVRETNQKSKCSKRLF